MHYKGQPYLILRDDVFTSDDHIVVWHHVTISDIYFCRYLGYNVIRVANFFRHTDDTEK